MAKEVSNEMLEKTRIEVIDALAKARGCEVSEIKSRYIGNNGFEPGQQVTFTGVVTIIESDGITPYYGAMTTTGGNVSVQSLMGISSMKGYKISGAYPNTVKASTKDKEAITENVEAFVTDDFDFEQVTQPRTRELYDFIAYLKESEALKGVTATFLGQVVRPYNAKKAGKMGETTWAKDDARVQTAKLWNY